MHIQENFAGNLVLRGLKESLINDDASEVQEPSSRRAQFFFLHFQILGAGLKLPFLHDNTRHKVGSLKYFSLDELLLLTLSLARGNWYYLFEITYEKTGIEGIWKGLRGVLTAETKTSFSMIDPCKHSTFRLCMNVCEAHERRAGMCGSYVWYKFNHTEMSLQRDFHSESNLGCPENHIEVVKYWHYWSWLVNHDL